MTVHDKIRDEKLQYNINKEAAEVPALSSGKIDKYKYFTGEKMLPLDQSRVTAPTKFTYYHLGKVLESGARKEIKSIEDAAKKQTKAIEEKVKKQLLDTNQKSITNSSFKNFYLKKLYMN